MPNTTQTLVEKQFSLTQYWTLEIKRKQNNGSYETDWYDITSYLLAKGQATISKQLDTEDYGWGNFSTSTLTFKLDNQAGLFFAETYQTSIFWNYKSRQYCKVRYASGYKDVDGSNINEVVFEGLINEKTIKTDIAKQSVTFTATSYESLLNDRNSASDQFTATSGVSTDIISSILGDTFISAFITYNAAKITPNVNTTFDDLSVFNDKTLKQILDLVAEKTNSAWYLDSSFEIVLTGRDKSANTPVQFTGGSLNSKDVNIIEFLDYNDGYNNIINNVQYDTGTTIHNFDADSLNLEKYGTFTKQLSGDELTTFSRIQTLANTIIEDNKVPRRRIKIRTLYIPNILELFDPVTITWFDSVITDDLFIWNFSYWNDYKYFMLLQSGFFIDYPTEWIVIGYTYNTADPYMELTLIESVN